MTSIPLAEAARAALRGDHLVVRQWAADCVEQRLSWSAIERPADLLGDELPVAAALVELMPARGGQAAPHWTSEVPEASASIYFVPMALRRSREVSETLGPEPLRRRRIFAMPNYLEFA